MSGTGPHRWSPGWTRRVVRAALSAALLVGLDAGGAAADDALVLPKGRFRISTEGQHYFPIKERFGPNGDVEDIATDFNRPLDSRVFTLLAPLDPFVGGRASIGDAHVSFDYRFTIFNVGVQYGITERLTAGVHVPYWWVTNRVDAQLDSGPGSSANVGRNPGPGPPVIPIASGGIPFTTEEVQQLLGPGLPGIPGFGFKRFETWSDDGFSDLEAFFKYQFLRTPDGRGAGMLGARFPTGQVDDPDNLVDVGFGTGAYAVLFRLHGDYVLSNLWERREASTPGILQAGDLMLNATFRYDLVLPDRELKRVPEDANNPLTRNKEIVDRDLGDRFEFEASARYALSRSFSLFSLYRYAFKLEDDVSGNRGFTYKSLEEETAATEHVYVVALTYSTVPAYLDKTFPIPVNISLAYRDRFAGSNNVFKSQYISLTLAFFL